MKEVALEPTPDIAKSTLKLWCRQKEAKITHYFSCARFDYGEKPFWAIVVRIFGWKALHGVYGFHVTDDCEVKLIGKMTGYGE